MGRFWENSFERNFANPGWKFEAWSQVGSLGLGSPNQGVIILLFFSPLDQVAEFYLGLGY